jgi:hypothetical protein
MDRTEKAIALIERAEQLGLGLKLDSGLILVKQTKSGDPDRQSAIIAELGKYISDVRALEQRSAIGNRAKGFVGQRVWFQDLGDGTLEGANNDGGLMSQSKRQDIDLRRHSRHRKRRKQISPSEITSDKAKESELF